MEAATADACTSNLSSSSFTRYLLPPDAYLGDDIEVEEDELKQEYTCPYCAHEFDIVGLFCHIDETHQPELQNGICPVCVKAVEVDMVGHITTQHGNILKVHRKRSFHRSAPNSMFKILRNGLREGNRQSLFGGSSFVLSSSNQDPDPLLSSFLNSLNTTNDIGKEEPRFIKGACSLPTPEVEKSSERAQKPLSKKDQEEKATKSIFVQGLLFSTMLDDIL